MWHKRRAHYKYEHGDTGFQVVRHIWPRLKNNPLKYFVATEAVLFSLNSSGQQNFWFQDISRSSLSFCYFYLLWKELNYFHDIYFKILKSQAGKVEIMCGEGELTKKINYRIKEGIKTIYRGSCWLSLVYAPGSYLEWRKIRQLSPQNTTTGQTFIGNTLRPSRSLKATVSKTPLGTRHLSTIEQQSRNIVRWHSNVRRCSDLTKHQHQSSKKQYLSVSQKGHRRTDEKNKRKVTCKVTCTF